MKCIKHFAPRVFIYLLGLFFCSAGYSGVGLSLSGSETKTIDRDELIIGDIELSGDAVLTVKNATLRVDHTPDDPRANIVLSGNAKLILDNAALVPPLEHPDNLYLTASGQSRIEIRKGTFINVLNLVERASVVGDRANITSSAEPLNIGEEFGAFGIVQLAGEATATFVDSTIGSFALFFGPNESADLSNLKPQTYKDFNLQRDSASFSPRTNIILKNTKVLPVKLLGPFERSWAIFADQDAKLTIKDSSLNKLVLQGLDNQTLEFKNLQLNQPQSFDFRDIHLTNTTVANEWGFFGENSNILVKNAKGVWLWPIKSGDWVLENAQMIEFDPRRFNGSLTCKNAEWANAGEIFEESHMTIKGDLKITQSLDEHLVIDDSEVTREFEILATKNREALSDFGVQIFDGQKKLAESAAKNGAARVSVLFTAENYKNHLTLKISADGSTAEAPMSFFSDTPIHMEV